MKLHGYQNQVVNRVVEQPSLALWLDMGLGKTVSTLTAIERLIYEKFQVNRVLVIAPKMVAMRTWSVECQKWKHLSHLSVAVAVGTEKERLQAIRSNAEIVVANVDVVAWLVKTGCMPLFDMVVVDESSCFKNASTGRFKAFKRHTEGKRVVLLSGTPAPNTLHDLYAQIYLLDQGERLGRTLGAFRERYFRPGKGNGRVVYEWILRKDGEEQIHKAIQDICVSMKAVDYLEMPDRIDIVEPIELPLEVHEKMAQLKSDWVLDDVVVASAGVLSNKLKQMANGFLYGEDTTLEIHQLKVERLVDIVERADSNVIVFYEYEHDLERIKAAIPACEGLDEARWCAGQIKVMALHPKSAGHGLNLQSGGSIIVWFSVPWSLEQYQQACARLHRQGQTKPVRIYHLTAENTIDEDVMAALQRKDMTQQKLLEAVKKWGGF